METKGRKLQGKGSFLFDQKSPINANDKIN